MCMACTNQAFCVPQGQSPIQKDRKKDMRLRTASYHLCSLSTAPENGHHRQPTTFLANCLFFARLLCFCRTRNTATLKSHLFKAVPWGEHIFEMLWFSASLSMMIHWRTQCLRCAASSTIKPGPRKLEHDVDEALDMGLVVLNVEVCESCSHPLTCTAQAEQLPEVDMGKLYLSWMSMNIVSLNLMYLLME